MANKIWRGDSYERAQVDTLTVGGTVEAGDLFIVTINGKSISTAATTTSTSTTATDIYTALAASEIAEFAELTYDDSSATIVVTGMDDGTPFTMTVATTESNGGAADAQTFGTAATTTPLSPYDWNLAGNWSASGVPGADTVYVSNTDVSIKWGLDQNGVTLAALNLHSTFTGDLGLPDINETTSTYEYRQTELLVNITALTIGEGDGPGSSLVRINGQAAQSTVNIYATGTSRQEGVPALRWRGTHASNVVNIRSGDLGIAWDATHTATVATLTIGSRESATSDAKVWCGSGCTLTTINQHGGVLTVNGAVGGTWTITAGDAYVRLSGTLAAVVMEEGAGTLFHDSTGTITALTIGAGAVFDASRSKAAFTVTNCTLYKGATLLDPNKRITFTNPILLSRCGPQDVTLDLGRNISLQRS